MNETKILREEMPCRVITEVFERNVPMVMSFLSDGRWNLARVLVTDVGDDCFSVKVSPRKKTRQINLRYGQSVGLSVKFGYGYDKYVFDTAVLALESPVGSDQGGDIFFVMPQEIEVVQRRNFLRVMVPESLQVDVQLCHYGKTVGKGLESPQDGWQGRLVDVSAGGMQVVVNSAGRADFERGDFVRLRFTPMPNETPIVFNAEVKTISQTANDENICFGLQMIGLEASPEGRMILRRLCSIVEQYHQMREPAVEQQGVWTANL